MDQLKSITGNIPQLKPGQTQIPQDRVFSTSDKAQLTANTNLRLNEMVEYQFSPTNEGTFSQTVTEDFCLRYLTCFLRGGTALGHGDKLNQLYIDGVPIAEIWCAGSDEPKSKELFFQFPDVLIREGTVLTLIATESGTAQSLTCLYCFIGYRLV